MPAKRLPWFRFWVDATSHGKVRQLDDGTFRTWVELLDLSSQQPKRGRFESRREAVAISRRPAKHIATLIAGRLIDEDPSGRLTMHDWDDWQRWRPEDANDSSTPPDQPPERHANDSRTTTESTPEDRANGLSSRVRASAAAEGEERREIESKKEIETIETKTKDPPAPAERPPTQIGKPPKIRAPISLDRIERLVSEYAPQFGSEALVRDWIARALNHTARLKALDEALYVERTWLKPELAKLKACSDPPSIQPDETTAPPGPARAWQTCSCGRRGNFVVSDTPLCGGCSDRATGPPRLHRVEAA